MIKIRDKCRIYDRARVIPNNLSIDEYSWSIQIASIPTYPGKISDPLIPCPRVNIWGEPNLVGPFITQPTTIIGGLNVVEGLSAGIDVFTWRDLQRVNITAQGPYTLITENLGLNLDQTKTQLRYAGQPGNYNVTIEIINIIAILNVVRDGVGVYTISYQDYPGPLCQSFRFLASASPNMTSPATMTTPCFPQAGNVTLDLLSANVSNGTSVRNQTEASGKIYFRLERVFLNDVTDSGRSNVYEYNII